MENVDSRTKLISDDHSRMTIQFLIIGDDTIKHEIMHLGRGRMCTHVVRTSARMWNGSYSVEMESLFRTTDDARFEQI